MLLSIKYAGTTDAVSLDSTSCKFVAVYNLELTSSVFISALRPVGSLTDLWCAVLTGNDLNLIRSCTEKLDSRLT
jgi:hypothetical protein